ncbi:hypothetical protein C8R43DRAFT_894337, partial [Mycena crocata]
ICTLQRDLTRKASWRFAEDDFEAHWITRCSVTEREDFILEGLVRACHASPEFEEARKWCPELTLNRLNRGSGKGYIELLTKLCLQDLDKIPDNFKIVPNAVYDQIDADTDPNPHPGEVLAKKACDSKRAYLLTMVVWNILLAFYGESETYSLMKGPRDDPEEARLLKKLIGSKMDIPRMRNETAANRQLGERHCTSCSFPAAKAGVAALSACQRCKAIGRLVFYCSKACQTTDWKAGKPSHKSICGKRGAIAEAHLAPKPVQAITDRDEDNDDFPPPERGYTRWPALLHQLACLRENPNADYVLVRPHPHPDHGLVVQNPMAKIYFKACLTRAICGHSPREVFKMFQLLEPTARGTPGFGVVKLKQQLMREYGIDVDGVKAEIY